MFYPLESNIQIKANNILMKCNNGKLKLFVRYPVGNKKIVVEVED